MIFSKTVNINVNITVFLLLVFSSGFISFVICKEFIFSVSQNMITVIDNDLIFLVIGYDLVLLTALQHLGTNCYICEKIAQYC